MARLQLRLKFILLLLLVISNNQIQAQYVQEDFNLRQAMYKIVERYDFLVTPIASAMAGGVICGPWCIVASGLAGSLDELLMHFSLSEHRYTTWGLFGLAAGNAVHPSDLSSTTGAIIGMLLPTGILQEHQKLVAPTAAAFAGYITAGIPGLLGGGALGVIDELKIHGGFAATHDLALATSGIAIAHAVKWLPPVLADCAGILLGTYMAAHEDEFVQNLLNTAAAINKAYETCGKFISLPQLNDHLEKQLLALVGNQYLTQFLSLKISKYNQKLNYNFERLDDKTGLARKRLNSEIVHFAIFLFPYLLGQTVTNNVDDYFSTKLQTTLKDQMKNALFSDEIMLKLSHSNDTDVLINNLDSDIDTITSSSIGLVTNTVAASINGVYGLGVIVITSPNIFVYHLLYDQVASLVSSALMKQQRKYNAKITDLNTKLTNTLAHDMKNIRTITEKNGVTLTRNKVQQLSFELSEYKDTRKLWSIVNNLWWSVSGTANSMFNYYLVSKEISSKRIPFEERSKIQTATWQVSGLFSSMRNNVRSSSELNTSLNRVMALEGSIYAQHHSEDQINRIITDTNKLTLQGLVIKIKDRILLSVQDMNFELGKIYAITGESGSGKTSLLSKIKGIKENNIAATGTISYPKVNGKEPKIVMLSQQEYLPLDSSLQEIISYPEPIPADAEQNNKQRVVIQNLLHKIGLCCFDNSTLTLDSKKDWDTVLSGGEKKKIALISAILQKPDILILDEIFNGLDKDSIKTVQIMLKEYLPHSLMLIIDHHAEDNDFSEFYDHKVRVVCGKLVDMS